MQTTKILSFIFLHLQCYFLLGKHFGRYIKLSKVGSMLNMFDRKCKLQHFR